MEYVPNVEIIQIGGLIDNALVVGVMLILYPMNDWMVIDVNPKAKFIENKLYFNNFVVIKKSDNYYEVREVLSILLYGDRTIAASSSFKKAAKKAKLLQIGYDMAREVYDPYMQYWCPECGKQFV